MKTLLKDIKEWGIFVFKMLLGKAFRIHQGLVYVYKERAAYWLIKSTKREIIEWENHAFNFEKEGEYELAEKARNYVRKQRKNLARLEKGILDYHYAIRIDFNDKAKDKDK